MMRKSPFAEQHIRKGALHLLRLTTPGKGSFFLSKICHRVNASSVADDFKMEVRAGGAAGASHVGNPFSLADSLTYTDMDS